MSKIIVIGPKSVVLKAYFCLVATVVDQEGPNTHFQELGCSILPDFTPQPCACEI